MTYAEWHSYGVDMGWIGPLVCATHDGIPTNEWEDDQFEQGEEVCLWIYRRYDDDEHRHSIQVNHAPSIWRD